MSRGKIPCHTGTLSFLKSYTYESNLSPLLENKKQAMIDAEGQFKYINTRAVILTVGHR